VLIAFAPANAAANSLAYALTRTVPLGGDGGWDYLAFDVAGHRLFISRGDRVMVVDPTSGTLIAQIPDTPGVHGIALAPDLGKGFISNGTGNSVTVFDLVSLKPSVTIPIAGQDPDAILYDPATKRVFTFDGRSNDANVFDARTNAYLGAIPLPGKPEFAASGLDGTIYANIEDTSELVAIDARTDAVVHAWPLAPCENPTGLSIDARNARLFVGCHNEVMAVVNARSGVLITTLPIGQGVDATAFDPGSALAFSSNGDGTLTVVHEDTPQNFSLAQNVTTVRYARTMALDPTTHTVYLVTAKFILGPPAPGEQRPSRTLVPGSFALLVVAPAP
jgi:DNA-binding beta-propeller fold protein YncE